MFDRKIVEKDGGLYVTISFLKASRYNPSLMKKVYLKLKNLGAYDTGKAKFYDVNVNNATYNAISKNDQVSTFDVSSGNICTTLKSYVLAYTPFNISFDNRVYWMELCTLINEDNTFGIWLNMSYDRLFSPEQKFRVILESNINMLKKIAFEVHSLDNFLYGMIGVEQEVYGLSNIINGDTSLPTNWAFYGNELLDILDRERILSLLSNCREIKEFNNGDIFFAWDDFFNCRVHESLSAFST